MEALTIYLDWIGGQWEAYYYSENETRRFHSWDRAEALRKAIATTGYDRKQIKVVNLHSAY